MSALRSEDDAAGSGALPAPLVPADVDLRDFAFMPLDVQRLRDSDLNSEETPDACWAAVLLWCAAWHQVPAGSIPDSDQWQAKHTGYVSRGRIDPQWDRVKRGALRGWVACNDGRLYHPVIAEKAIDAWRSKLAQRHRAECARIKKHNQRHGTQVPFPDLDAWIAAGCPSGPLPIVPGDKASESPGTEQARPQSVPRETPSKGQGEGQGQGDLKTKTMVAAVATTAPPPSPPLKAKDLIAEGVDRQVAADWLALRKGKRLPLTVTAWQDTKAEGAKVGLSPAETVSRAVANNWAGFKASWAQRDASGRAQAPAPSELFAGAL
jgi:hypothetical protein